MGKKFIEEFSFSSFLNFKTQFAKGFKYSTNEEGNEIRTEKTRIFSPAGENILVFSVLISFPSSLVEYLNPLAN